MVQAGHRIVSPALVALEEAVGVAGSREVRRQHRPLAVGRVDRALQHRALFVRDRGDVVVGVLLVVDALGKPGVQDGDAEVDVAAVPMGADGDHIAADVEHLRGVGGIAVGKAVGGYTHSTNLATDHSPRRQSQCRASRRCKETPWVRTPTLRTALSSLQRA